MDWSRHMRSIIERLGEDITHRPLASTGTATVRAMYIAPFARALRKSKNCSRDPRFST